MKSEGSGRSEKLPLSKAIQTLLDECRMLLPGVQAMLGFQLTVVFNPGFREKLTPTEQSLHFAAIVLMTLAMVLLMTPAAYHRQTHPEHATEGFIRLASRIALAGLVPLGVSVCLELHLVGNAIHGGSWVSASTALIASLMLFFWFVLPRLQRRNTSESAPLKTTSPAEGDPTAGERKQPGRD